MSPEISRRRSERLRSRVEGKDSPLWLHALLFIVTFITMTYAGSTSSDSIVGLFITGLPYSITLIMILLSHEMGHYLAARRFGVRATLPYFIPFPSIIGTMGALIKLKPQYRTSACFYTSEPPGP